VSNQAAQNSRRTSSVIIACDRESFEQLVQQGGLNHLDVKKATLSVAFEGAPLDLV